MNTEIYLQKLYNIQKRILLVSRLKKDEYWNTRAFFLTEEYNPNIEYNHRSMLDNEVVIEWDLDNHEMNRKYADELCKRFKKCNIEFSKFSSGNKSVHVHTLIDIQSAKNIPSLKRQFIKFFTKGLPQPDMQLCNMNHLIRCEYGIHEKTGNRKTLISKSPNYPCVNEIPAFVWQDYISEQERISKMKLTKALSPLSNSDAIKFILDTKNFEGVRDGRKRALFALIWTLKGTMSKEDLIQLLTNWYKYVQGNHYTEKDIIKYIDYYEVKTYSHTFYKNYINDLLTDLGQDKIKIL